MHAERAETGRADRERGTKAPTVKAAGFLLLGGSVFNALVTSLWHPSGEEDVHPKIFSEYADSGSWEVVHFLQFIGVLATLAGLFVLCLAMREWVAEGTLIRLAGAAVIVTAAVYSVLQALDAVALKQAVDAWAAAPAAAQSDHFANAETVRWAEWAFQSYFRVLLGISLALIGAGMLLFRLAPGWLGGLALIAGVLSAALGVDVAFNGLASGFQDVTGMLFLLTSLAFAVALAAGAGGRPSGPHSLGV